MIQTMEKSKNQFKKEKEKFKIIIQNEIIINKRRKKNDFVYAGLE